MTSYTHIEEFTVTVYKTETAEPSIKKINKIKMNRSYVCVCSCVGGGLIGHLLPGYLPLLKLVCSLDTERISDAGLQQPVLLALQGSKGLAVLNAHQAGFALAEPAWFTTVHFQLRLDHQCDRWRVKG